MHKIWLNSVKSLIFSGLFFMTACAGPPLKLVPIPVTANPTEEVGKLQIDIANARQQQVNVLAPTWFNKAESSLAEAKRLIAEKGDMGMIGTNVSKGHAEITKALEMANISRTVIPEAIKGRDLARVAGATTFAQSYTDAEEQFLDLTREIENNNVNYAQRNEQKVVNSFRVLEIKAIKETTLGEVRKLLTQADKEGAKKLAPTVFAQTQKELQDVDNYISANPYAKEEMHLKAAAALFQANRLLQLTRQSETFRKMQPIEVALWTEDVIENTSEKLGAPDMRDQSTKIQISNMMGTAGALKADRDFLSEKSKGQQTRIDGLLISQQNELQAIRQKHSEEISDLQSKLATEVGQKERLEIAKRAERERLKSEKQAIEDKLAGERKFNEQYNQVQALFTSEEAECYKQGQQMVVRLRGMSFPVGQSIIMPENYALLSKVQHAIRTFDDPSVTIEGHTDSTGTLELNNHLSQMRAEAVRGYLLANALTTEDKVTAVGYGSSRPLSPNATTEGRAQNRRIDLIITPKGQLTM